MKRVSLVLLSSILFLCTSTLLADEELDQLKKKAEAGIAVAQEQLWGCLTPSLTLPVMFSELFFDIRICERRDASK